MPDSAEEKIIAEALTSESAFSLLEELCDNYSSRFAGSEEEREAGEYLAEKMRNFGLEDVELLTFEYKGWQRGDSSLLAVCGEKSREFPCIGLPYSPSGEVKAELVDLGFGTPAEFSQKENIIPGKIVLVSAKRPLYAREDMHRRDKYRRAVEAGARGFLWMREEGGHLAETGGLPHDAGIPAAGISRETGYRLKRLRKSRDLSVKIESEHSFGPTKSHNVLGRLTGQKGLRDEPRLLAGAHYDGHDIAEGALDNGAGTAIVMEAARLLSTQQQALGIPVDFVLFAAEEIDLVGSGEFANHQCDDNDYRFMVNLDGGPGRPGGNLGLALQGWPELLSIMEDVSSKMSLDMQVAVDPGSHSDMYSFSEAGIPSGYFKKMEEMATGRNWGHTRADTLDKVDEQKLREDALLLARFLLHLSRVEEWPELQC